MYKDGHTVIYNAANNTRVTNRSGDTLQQTTHLPCTQPYSLWIWAWPHLFLLWTPFPLVDTHLSDFRDRSARLAQLQMVPMHQGQICSVFFFFMYRDGHTCIYTADHVALLAHSPDSGVFNLLLNRSTRDETCA